MRSHDDDDAMITTNGGKRENNHRKRAVVVVVMKSGLGLARADFHNNFKAKRSVGRGRQ